MEGTTHLSFLEEALDPLLQPFISFRRQILGKEVPAPLLPLSNFNIRIEIVNVDLSFDLFAGNPHTKGFFDRVRDYIGIFHPLLVVDMKDLVTLDSIEEFLIFCPTIPEGSERLRVFEFMRPARIHRFGDCTQITASDY